MHVLKIQYAYAANRDCAMLACNVVESDIKVVHQVLKKDRHDEYTGLKVKLQCRIFIGQASGKGVGSGMKQAEQKKVLTDFRSGAFNTLVATCIGEEGLDIPQVWLPPSELP